MTRPAAVEPYLRGCAFAGVDGVPYPRADLSDDRLPVDTRRAACRPAGVRLELVGDADAVEVDLHVPGSPPAGPPPGGDPTLSCWRHGAPVADVVVHASGTYRVPLGGGDPDAVAHLHLPEALGPTVLAVRPVGGRARPAPPGARWACYGDSITEGWSASSPARAWPAVAARRTGADTVNLGYAGAARGEPAVAGQVASLPADLVVVAFGTNCWSRVPHDAALLAATTGAFLAVVRRARPTVPIVVVSPLPRPDAEAAGNDLGATLGDLRLAMEAVVDARIRDGDRLVTLVRGPDVVDPGHLVDGVHPGDEGHERLAAAVVAAARRLGARSAAPPPTGPPPTGSPPTGSPPTGSPPTGAPPPTGPPPPDPDAPREDMA